MMRSIATQTTSELGGPRSILVRRPLTHGEDLSTRDPEAT